MHQRLAIVLAATAAAACTADPVYVQPPAGVEVGLEGDMGVATAVFALPFDAVRLSSTEYARQREERLIEINLAAIERDLPEITLDQLPLVRLDQIDLSIEWTLKNLADAPGLARIHVNGGNQFFVYDPSLFIIEEDEEEAVPPPLAGDIPIEVPPLGTVSGVFREDQLREGALDLELITRGQVNPFAALLSVHEEIEASSDVAFSPFPPEQDPPPVPPPGLPVAAFGHLVQLNFVLEADQHMVLEYAVRVRDPDELLHDELTAAPPEELQVFMPATYTPPVAAP